MNSLTVRIEGDRGIISRDDGQSAQLGRGDLAELTGLLTRERAWTHGALTAAARALLAEATAIIPRTDLWREDTHIYELKHGEVELPSSRLGSLLSSRYSQRRLGSCRLDELLAVLVMANAVLDATDGPDGYTISHRGAPSAGARHPLTLTVASLKVDALESGLYDFDPFKCELQRRLVTAEAMASAVDKVILAGRLNAAPAAVIFLVCDFVRTLSRYPSGAAFAWLDAGALALLLQLAAVDTGLGSCIVGTCGALETIGIDGVRQDLIAVAIGSTL